MKYFLDIRNDGRNIISEDLGHGKMIHHEIEDTIFQDELVDYYIISVDDEIDSLYRWIWEATDEYQKDLMKTDLRQLEDWKDAYALSNINTNEYLLESDGYALFDEKCEEIINENKRFIEENK